MLLFGIGMFIDSTINCKVLYRLNIQNKFYSFNFIMDIISTFYPGVMKICCVNCAPNTACYMGCKCSHCILMLHCDCCTSGLDVGQRKIRVDWFRTHRSVCAFKF